MPSLMRRRISAIVGVGLLATTVALAASSADGAGGATPSTVGDVPPNNPALSCTDINFATVKDINKCRALEGVGPMVLPSNYNSLTPPQQMLVVFNLERVNRGETPIVGLNATLNTYSQGGSDSRGDPGFPSDLTGDADSIYASNATVIGADYAWMYDDGLNPDGTSGDSECSPSTVSECWGHRDSILKNSEPNAVLVVGAAITVGNVPFDGKNYNSYAAETVYDYHPDQLTFTWASELPYFASPPAIEPLSTSTPSPSPTPTPTVTATPTSTPTPSATATSGLVTMTKSSSQTTARRYSRFPGRFTVTVTTDGTPDVGVPVTFTEYRHGVSLGSTTVTTDSTGVARAPVLHTGAPGRARVTATTPGGLTVTWNLRIT